MTWPDSEWANVSGALADTGNLPGDLRPSEAIRRLTAERDALRGECDELRAALGELGELAHDAWHETEYVSEVALAERADALIPRVRAVLSRRPQETDE